MHQQSEPTGKWDESKLIRAGSESPAPPPGGGGGLDGPGLGQAGRWPAQPQGQADLQEVHDAERGPARRAADEQQAVVGPHCRNPTRTLTVMGELVQGLV